VQVLKPAAGLARDVLFRPRRALSLNGLSLNGLSLNGLSLNGLSLTGLPLRSLCLILRYLVRPLTGLLRAGAARALLIA
jgi:hypothetical protein